VGSPFPSYGGSCLTCGTLLLSESYLDVVWFGIQGPWAELQSHFFGMRKDWKGVPGLFPC
jgi:hypothetical protein